MRGFGISVLLGAAALLAATPAVRADGYSVDGAHSSVFFRVHHFEAGYVGGTFSDMSGQINYDPADASKDSFDITVTAESLNTLNKMRDNDLKGPDFFDAKQFPTLTFKSTSVKKAGDTSLEVTGDFTVHGVTKSVTFNMDVTGTGKGMKGETRTGFEANLTIDRRDFGLTYDPAPAIGNDIRLIVDIEAAQQ